MELLVEAEIIPEDRIKSLRQEMNEIVAMIVASIKTLRSKNLKSN